ncbi:hypothetical protein NL676_001724 [Syzygium grande]|nr:hypothetical protein NL676_001724 [Syzygium grande]
MRCKETSKRRRRGRGARGGDAQLSEELDEVGLSEELDEVGLREGLEERPEVLLGVGRIAVSGDLVKISLLQILHLLPLNPPPPSSECRGFLLLRFYSG